MPHGPLSYYPSARVRLIVRLEDYGAPGSPKPPKRPVVNRRGVKDSAATSDVRVVEQDGAFVLKGPGLKPGQTGGPHAQVTSSDGLTFAIDGVVPLAADHDRNGPRVADTLKLQIQWMDLPVDPRPFRSIGVEYVLGTVDADDWDRGVRGEMRPDATAQGLALPYNIVPDTFTDRRGRTRSNVRFQGWVDEIGLGLPKDGAAVIELDCTDNTRLLIEEDAPPGLVVDPSTRIDKAIANYLAAFPQLRGLQVEYRPAVPESRIPVLKDALTRGAYPPKLGPTPSGSGKLTVWDYLTDVCGALGHMCFVDGVSVVVQRPRTLYASGFNIRPGDPFTGRTLADGTLLPSRTWVYGDNLLEFEMRRRMTRAAAPNIEVRSYLPQRKKTLVVRYPDKPDRQTKRIPGDNTDQKYVVKVVWGIGDKPTLSAIAQAAYEAEGRLEVEATTMSKNLSTLGGDNVDPDALDAVPGDTIDVFTAPPGDEGGSNTVQVVAEESPAAQRLINLGFAPDFSAAYARTYSAIGFPHTFRVRTNSTRWQNDENGLEVQMSVINYVEVRADAKLPEGQEITPAESSLSPEPEPTQVEDVPQ